MLAAPSDLEHFMAEIGTNHGRFRIRFFAICKGQIAGSCADIEYRRITGWRYFPDRSPTPISVDLHAQQMVHPIVTMCNLTEHSPDAGCRFINSGFVHYVLDDASSTELLLREPNTIRYRYSLPQWSVSKQLKNIGFLTCWSLRKDATLFYARCMLSRLLAWNSSATFHFLALGLHS